jgi:hypothetical protein
MAMKTKEDLKGKPVPIQELEFPDVRQRALELGCNIPDGIAILPLNFDDAKTKGDLYHASSAATVRTLWRQEKILETRIEKEGDKFPSLQLNAAEWLSPVIFVSAAMWSQNPHAVSVALNVISNYLTDWFKGIAGEKTVRLTVVTEKTKTKNCVAVRYEGSVKGMKKLPAILREVAERE